MSLFTTLCESSDPIAKEVATTIRIHPAFSYIRTSFLYDHIYRKFLSECDNIKEARLRTMLHVTHILDEISHSLGIIDTNIRTSIPDLIYEDALKNPKFKAYSDAVLLKSSMRRKQRLAATARKKETTATVETTVASANELSSIAFSWTVKRHNTIDDLVKDIKTGKDAISRKP